MKLSFCLALMPQPRYNTSKKPLKAKKFITKSPIKNLAADHFSLYIQKMATKFVFFFCFTLAVFQSWAVATKQQETLTLTGSKIAQLTLTPSKKWDLKGRAK